MYRFVRQVQFRGLLCWLSCWACLSAWAGGSGYNSVVVVNQASANSVALGNYFCERRQVPPDNVLRITWTGGNTNWSSDDFESYLLTPLLNLLSERQLTTQVDYVVLSMDIPFQTLYGAKVNSTTSALFYGLQDDTGAYWMNVTNSYYGSERTFDFAKPAVAPGYSFLAVMITGSTLAQAEAVVDQGVASDGTFPAQPVILAKTSDPARNVRYKLFDNAVFNTRLRGNYAMFRTNSDSPSGLSGLLGYETGLASYTVSSNTFVPGAMADSLTSFGGIIFGPNSQTTLLAFLAAGAAGSYGTVVEPTSSTQKFPDPQNYFYQARGFSLAECYYQSVYAPYEGLIAGEPLAAPFSAKAAGAWIGVTSNAVLRGTVQVGAAFAAPDANHPVRQIDLFVDGKYFQTLTNLGPSSGNLLTVALNGYPIGYTVPANADLPAVAAGLANQLNVAAVTNLTQVAAFAHGDRMELHSLAANGQALPFYFVDGATTNAAGRYYKTAFPAGSLSPQLSSLGCGSDGAFHMHVETTGSLPYVVEATSDFIRWTGIFTNQAGGSSDFIDPQAPPGGQRFYRTLVLAPALPVATVVSSTNVTGTLVRIDGALQPYVIMASSDQAHWTPIFTNAQPASVQVGASSTTSGAGVLSCFLGASQPAFLASIANGLRSFCLGGSLSVGASLQLSVTKTNGVSLAVGVTNASASAGLFDFAQQLAAVVNATPALQGTDGLTVEDVSSGAFGTASFNLRALGEGWQAAGIAVQLTASGGVTTSPSSQVHLDANQPDLQPRDHLYVTAGASDLAASFGLDTTRLADGSHELEAVAYEGSDVHTQSRITLPVQVQNSTLAATLAVLDAGATAPAQGALHIQVSANTAGVSTIGLYSTGGLLGSVANQSSSTFTVDASYLGVGLHPFYALVQTAGGQQYRTATQWIRLVSP